MLTSVIMSVTAVARKLPSAFVSSCSALASDRMASGACTCHTVSKPLIAREANFSLQYNMPGVELQEREHNAPFKEGGGKQERVINECLHAPFT